MAMGKPVTPQGLKKGALGCIVFLFIFPILVGITLYILGALFGWEWDDAGVIEGNAQAVLTVLTIAGGAAVFARFASQAGNPSEHESLPDLPVPKKEEVNVGSEKDYDIRALRQIHLGDGGAFNRRFESTSDEIVSDYGKWIREGYGERLEKMKAISWDTLPHSAEKIDEAIEQCLHAEDVDKDMKEMISKARLYLYIPFHNPETGEVDDAPLSYRPLPRDP